MIDKKKINVQHIYPTFWVYGWKEKGDTNIYKNRKIEKIIDVCHRDMKRGTRKKIRT